VDINISGNSCSIDCWTTRWDVQNYSVIIETFMNKSDLQDLRDSMTPQATGELYTILGRPKYYDSTWSASNTLKITPTTSTQMSKMRNDLVGFVKNVNDSPMGANTGLLTVKLEFLISGAGSL